MTKLFWPLVFIALAAWLFCTVGCVRTVDCRHPEAALFRRGVVLECGWTWRDGKKYRSCLVVKPGGDTATVVLRSCPEK